MKSEFFQAVREGLQEEVDNITPEVAIKMTEACEQLIDAAAKLNLVMLKCTRLTTAFADAARANKECPYCQGGQIFFNSSGTAELNIKIRDFSKTMSVVTSRGDPGTRTYLTIDIEACPFCGRKLKELNESG